MTNQPEWEFITNLGDVSPLDHGGLFLYKDKTGVYEPELERCEPIENGKFLIHRVSLERYKRLDKYLVSIAYNDSWPNPAPQYQPWFKDRLQEIDESRDCYEEEIIEELCSDDPKKLASAYEAIYNYLGWDNGDSYPLTITREEAEKRYQNELRGS